MSSQVLIPHSFSDEVFDINEIFTILDSLIDLSDSEAELEVANALQYLHDTAFKCDN